jgi:hypothetical protein
MQVLTEIFQLPLTNQYLKKFGKYKVGQYEKDCLIKHILINFFDNNLAEIEIKAQDNVGIFIHSFYCNIVYEELTQYIIKLHFYQINK